MYDARFKRWKVRKNVRRLARHDARVPIGLLAESGDIMCQQDPIEDEDIGDGGHARSSYEPASVPSPPSRQSPGSPGTGSMPSASSIIYTPGSGASPGSQTVSELFQKPMSLCSTSLRNGEILLKVVTTYFTHRMDLIFANIHSQGTTSTTSNGVDKLFWDNIENGIYLYKISSQFPDKRGRASKAFQDAGTIALRTLADEPFDFLRKLFLVLSPINTSIHPPLRRILLCCIANAAGQALGSGHPITLICELLLQDGSVNLDNYDCPLALSREVLYHMQALSSTQLGDTHAATCKLVKSIITMERRCGDMQAAEGLARGAYDLNKAASGSSSVQTREAAMELGYIVARMGDTDRALALYLDVVQNTSVPDHVLIYAMEAVAEQHIDRRNFQDAADWLLQAQTVAMKTSHGRLATLHLTDKLEHALRRKTMTD